MIVIGTNGQYEVQENTKTLRSSDHPVYQAQIEINLARGSWIGAPDKGHNIAPRVRQSEAALEEFRKEVRTYLSKYDPETQEMAINRSGATLPVLIPRESSNA